MPLSPDELHTLLDTTNELAKEMTGLRLALATADRRSRWARTVGTVGVVVGIIGGAVGLLGVAVGVSAQDTADTNAKIRKETQVSACIQSNLTTQRTRDALIAGVSVLTQPNPNRGANEQASVDRFVVEYSRHIQAALPFRDCSSGGITAYFLNPPIDPALGSLIVPTTTTTGG